MKRIGNIYHKVYDLKNIELADDNARKHKKHTFGIQRHDKNRDIENMILSDDLENLTYKTSPYSTFTIYEPKERLIFRLPYYPDRITHHAIMNVMESIWTKIFVKGTYSCIKNRGIIKVLKDLKKDLSDYRNDTTYCLKMDIRKFYPSIDHDILYEITQKKLKDPELLTLLKEIINSADGVPIGNYLSQFFANLYLAYFDHWVKEELKCKFYYRYADDVVILDGDKNHLRNILLAIKIYLKYVLKLELKPNYQIFPVDDRGIDFVGYKFYHSHILLRKSIKKKLFKLIKRYKDKKIGKEELKRRMQSYFGWLKYCNSKHLLQKIQRQTGIRFSNWNGEKTKISKFYNKYIRVIDVVRYSKFNRIHFTYNNKSYYFDSKGERLLYLLSRYNLPVNFKIVPYERTKKN